MRAIGVILEVRMQATELPSMFSIGRCEMQAKLTMLTWVGDGWFLWFRVPDTDVFEATLAQVKALAQKYLHLFGKVAVFS